MFFPSWHTVEDQGGARHSAVQDGSGCVQSSRAVMLECIRLYMGFTVTAVTASRVRKCIPLRGCADIGHLAKVPKDTRAAKH